MTIDDCYFGYTEGGVAATEWYEGVPQWWALPVVPAKVRVKDLGAGLRGFAVPWAMVARTEEGYFVGVCGCLERTWSPHGGYSDPFVPLLVLNLRAR